jgi:hypothetical protein
MNLANRAALTIIPKQPYAEWANSVDDQEPKLSLESPHVEYTVYLIGNVANDRGVAAALKEHYAEIFEEELAVWMQDEKTWPKNRDYRMFREWFEVKVSSMVLDLGNDRIEVEEFDS